MRHAKTVFSMAAVMSLLCLRLASDVLAAEGDQGIVKTGRGTVAKYRKEPAGLEQSLIDEARKQALAPAVKEAIAAYESARKGAQ